MSGRVAPQRRVPRLLLQGLVLALGCLQQSLPLAAPTPLPARSPPPSVHHVINLSNGIEALADLRAAGVAADRVGVMRLQSSHCEAQAFDKILRELDHGLLLRLALGEHVCVYDVGSRASQWPDGNRWVPRAIWWGLEWVKYVLNDVWGLEPAADRILLRGYNVDDLFRRQLFKLPKDTRKRLKYYRPYLATEHLRLFGAFRKGGTALDGNKEAYREILHYEFGISPDASRLPEIGSLDDKLQLAPGPAPQPTSGGDEAQHEAAGLACHAWWEEDLEFVRRHVVGDFELYNPYNYAGIGRGRIKSRAPNPPS